MKKFEIKVYRHIKIEKLRYNFYIVTTNRMHGASRQMIIKNADSHIPPAEVLRKFVEICEQAGEQK